MSVIHPGLWNEFLEKGRVDDCPVYDMHAHMGYYSRIYFPRGECNDLDRVLARAGVKLLVFCHHASLFSPDIGNRSNIEWVRRFPECLRAYCGINPHYPDMIKQDIDTFDQFKDIYVGFKMLADYHLLPLDHPAYKPAWEKADAEGLLVLLHTWSGSQYDGPEQVRKAAEKYQNAKILMGHSCHGAWDEAIKLVKDFPNVYFELCAVIDDRGFLERFVEKTGSKQIVFGTDFPWFDHHYYIGAVLGAGLSDDDCHNIFHRNAERILTGLID